MNEKTESSQRVGFCSWSGGKDSCLALHKIQLERPELKIPFLLNMVGTEDEPSIKGPHGLRSEIFSAQAKAMGRKLVQVKTDWSSYEKNFKREVRKLKRETEVDFGIFGDSELDEHREWVESTCRELGIEPFLPLWGKDPEEIYCDFVDTGFEAILVNLNADLFTKNQLGLVLNSTLLQFLKKAGIHPVGEGGEYHSLVVDGPLFDFRLKINRARKEKNEGRLQYDILELGHDN